MTSSYIQASDTDLRVAYARVREALAPFSHAAFEADGWPDETAFTIVLRPDDEDGLAEPGDEPTSLITARQLRAAREALTKADQMIGRVTCSDCGGNGYSGGVMPAEDMRGEYDVACEVCCGRGHVAVAIREALVALITKWMPPGSDPSRVHSLTDAILALSGLLLPATLTENVIVGSALSLPGRDAGNQELQEIADGAYGDGPAVRGRARDRLAPPISVDAPKRCTCAEIHGENPNCALHGRCTEWAKENPDIEDGDNSCRCIDCGGDQADHDPDCPHIEELLGDEALSLPANGWQTIDKADKVASPRKVIDLWVVHTSCTGRVSGERSVNCAYYRESATHAEGWHDQWGNKIEWTVDPDKVEEGRVANEGRVVTHFHPLPAPPATPEPGK